MKEWEQFLTTLEKDLGKNNVDKWLRPLKIIKFDARNLYLQVENSFQLSWFKEYVQPKLIYLKNRNSKPIRVIFTPNQKKKSTYKNEEITLQFDPLDPIFHLSNFYISKKNKILLNLISELSESKKNIYLGSFNPIYIYGPSGSGKTHLLTSISKVLIEKKYNLLFVHADLFTRHVVLAIRQGIMNLFRKTYRNVDVLIIDDIHLLARKAATQEEFFHTFNSLHTLNKQLIISSRCQPQLLEEIEPRLVSRFEWGIISNLEKLDFHDLKDAISLKANQFNVTLNDEQTNFLIQKFSSIENLSNAFDTLLLRAKMPIEGLSIDQIGHLLLDLIKAKEKKIVTHDSLIKAVVTYFGVQTKDIMDRNQSRESTFLRQITMYLLRHDLRYPFTKIGKLFQKDHSTVMSSVRKIDEKLKKDSELKTVLYKIRKKIEEGS